MEKQTNTYKAKKIETLENMIVYLKSRKDIIDLEYKIKEIDNKSLKYQLDYSFNWK